MSYLRILLCLLLEVLYNVSGMLTTCPLIVLLTGRSWRTGWERRTWKSGQFIWGPLRSLVVITVVMMMIVMKKKINLFNDCMDLFSVSSRWPLRGASDQILVEKNLKVEIKGKSRNPGPFNAHWVSGCLTIQYTIQIKFITRAWSHRNVNLRRG